MIHQADVFHEPDMISPPYIRSFKETVTRFGPAHVFVNKFRKTGSCRLLAIARARGRISETGATEAFIKIRSAFVSGLPKQIYGEANMQLAGLLDILPEAFPNSTIVFIIRDPRDWRQSCHNWSGGVYGWRDYVYRARLGRLNARMLPEDPWHDCWPRMSQFQKECWLWWKIYSHGVQTVKKTPTARLWRFEDIFYAENRYENLSELLDFLTAFPDGTVVPYNSPTGLLEEKIHAPRKEGFPSWPDWPESWAKQMDAICGDLMGQFGYGQEPEWFHRCKK